ncbi:PAS domain S-box protein [Dapis sp. BLCC M172]|uniref:PAS domain-containing sensor histidine kinase n=1 Tax=Dapis sp. BLCC M172 TaxID=2975281 RepID=UPI003CED6A98
MIKDTSKNKTDLIASLKASNAKLKTEIRERKRAEKALQDLVKTYQETSLKLRTLINAMPDIVCFKDGTGKWLEANKSMLELFDIEKVDYHGKLDAELGEISDFYQEAFLNCQHSDQEAWNKKSLSRGEEVIQKKDGTVKIYDVTKVPLFYEDGTRNGIVVLGRDITEQKQTEKDMMRLASIVESSNDAIIGNTLAGIIHSWNSGAEEIYGYSISEVKGHSISMLAVPERPNEIPRILANITAGIGIDNYETVHLRKDGKHINVALTISPIKDTQNNVIGVSTIARDISDRKQVEQSLEQLRHQHQLILDSAGEGICVIDIFSKISFVNPAAAKMTGYGIKELVNNDWNFIIYGDQTNNKTNRISTEKNSQACAVNTTLEKGIVCQVTDELFGRRDGTFFPVEYVSTPILEQGKITGAVVTFKDITERLAVEQMKDEFISVVSHELRTPLASIHGALGLLKSGLLNQAPTRGRRMLDIAVANSDRLVRLVNDILDLERLHSHQVTMVKQTCNVSELMMQAASEMQPIAEKIGVSLSVTPIDTKLWGCADRLIQILTNLLSNAIKYSSTGKTVWLTASKQRINKNQVNNSHHLTCGIQGDCAVAPACRINYGDQVLIMVKDQGRGIPADKIESIFGRFQQVDASDSRQKGGTGLGLAICRSIVQQHEGQIWAESTLGKGSTFFVALPILD